MDPNPNEAMEPSDASLPAMPTAGGEFFGIDGGGEANPPAPGGKENPSSERKQAQAAGEKPESEGVEEPETPEENPEESGEETPEDGSENKLFADEFKTAEELATAYKALKAQDVERAQKFDLSSKEGKRLAGVVQRQQVALKEAKRELLKSSLQSQVGSFKELSKEEYDALDADAKMDYKLNKRDFESNKKNLDKMIEEDEADERKNNLLIKQDLAHMEANPGQFPGLADTQELQHELLDRFPWLENIGKAGMNRILYFCARGIQYNRSLAAKPKQDAKADDTAAKQARANAARNGSTVRSGTVTAPVPGKGSNLPKGLDPVNYQLLEAGNKIL